MGPNSSLQSLSDDTLLESTLQEVKKERNSTLKVIEITPPADPIPTFSSYVPKGIKREVWRRNQGQCAYQDPRTGRRCSATSYLQYDHIIPFAMGGPTIIENLRLLCANHNRLRGMDQFGKYRRKPEARSPRLSSNTQQTNPNPS